MRRVLSSFVALLISGIIMCPAYLEGRFKGQLYDPLSARAAGMAGAVSSIAGDYVATMFNPATIGFSDQVETYLTYCQRQWEISDPYYSWPDDVEHYFSGGVVYPSLSLGTFGADFAYSLSDEIHATDRFGNPFENLRAYTIVARLSYGRRLNEELALGAAMKFFRDAFPGYLDESLRQTVGNSVALDASMLYKTPIPTVNVAVSITDIGPDIRYSEIYESHPLPRTLRMGLSAMPLEDGVNRLLLTFDIAEVFTGFDMIEIFTGPKAATLSWGAEHTFFDIVAVRAGYLRDTDSDLDGFTYGIGLRFRNIFSFDFADMSHAHEHAFINIDKYYFTANLLLPMFGPPRPEETQK